MDNLDQNQKTQVTITPTLFLFLGSSAGKIAWEVKKLNNQAFGKDRAGKDIHIPIYRYLWVDIDPADTQVESILDPEERIVFQDVSFDPPKIIRNIDAYPQVKAWWPAAGEPGRLSGNGSPAQRRSTGRLSLFHYFNSRFFTSFENAINAITVAANADATRQIDSPHYSFNVFDSPKVIMVFSPCGGTGSALSFDMAYLCRSKMTHPKIITYQVMPDVITSAGGTPDHTRSDNGKANCYAWFKEDNYLSEHTEWRVMYDEKGGHNVTVQDRRPFDTRFILAMCNTRGKRLSKDTDIYQMIAQTIFIKTGSRIDQMNGAADTDCEVFDTRHPARDGKLRLYSSMASASLVFPEKRILEYAREKYAADVLTVALGNTNAVDLATNTHALLDTLGLTRDILGKRLKANEVIPMEQRSAIQHAGEVAIVQTLLTTQKASMDSWLHQFQQDLDEERDTIITELKQKFMAEILDDAISVNLPTILAILQILKNSLEPSSSLLRENCPVELISMNDVPTREKQYNSALEQLISVDNDFVDIAQKNLDKKAWQLRLTSAGNSCIKTLEELYKQRKQKVIIDAVISIFTALRGESDSALQSVESIQAIFIQKNNEAQEAAKQSLENARVAVEHGFFLRQEIEVDLAKFYDTERGQLEPARILSMLVPAEIKKDAELFRKWCEKHLLEKLRSQGEIVFQHKVNSANILDAFRWQIANEGGTEEDVCNAIEKKVDDLLIGLAPFISVSIAGTGLNEASFTTRKTISFGIANPRDDALIPQKYRQHAEYLLNRQGFRNRIDVLIESHGYPAYIISDMESYKNLYFGKLNDMNYDQSLHIFPGALAAEDLFPQADVQKAAEDLFNQCLLLGFIYESGNMYYKDLGRAHVPGMPNLRADSLGQVGGWDNAIGYLRLNQLIRSELKEAIESEMGEIGQRGFIRIIETTVANLRNAAAENPNTTKSQRYLSLAQWGEAWCRSLRNQ